MRAFVTREFVCIPGHVILFLYWISVPGSASRDARDLQVEEGAPVNHSPPSSTPANDPPPAREGTIAPDSAPKMHDTEGADAEDTSPGTSRANPALAPTTPLGSSAETAPPADSKPDIVSDIMSDLRKTDAIDESPHWIVDEAELAQVARDAPFESVPTTSASLQQAYDSMMADRYIIMSGTGEYCFPS